MRTKNYQSVFIIILIVGLFLLYRYGFGVRFFNVLPQTTKIELREQNQTILIEKHSQQGNIHQLELTITGKLSDNITLYLSKDGVSGYTSIRIKKGKVKTSFIAKWTYDTAYILIENPYKARNTLNIEYQFITQKS